MRINKKKNDFAKDWEKNRIKWLLLLPSALVIILMCYIPMSVIILAFKEYNFQDGIFGSPFVGFNNFHFFFLSGKVFSITRNTLLYNMTFWLINTCLQISCAFFVGTKGKMV